MCIATFIDKMTQAVIGWNSKNISWYFNRGIDTVKITALSNHKPGILKNYIRMLRTCCNGVSRYDNCVVILLHSPTNAVNFYCYSYLLRKIMKVIDLIYNHDCKTEENICFVCLSHHIHHLLFIHDIDPNISTYF
jgi:hypothetical protein